MKNLILSLFLLLSIALTSCADDRVIDNVRYEPVGWFGERNPNIEYSYSGETIIWSIIFSETIIAPILLTGTALWEPEYKKPCSPNCRD